MVFLVIISIFIFSECTCILLKLFYCYLRAKIAKKEALYEIKNIVVFVSSFHSVDEVMVYIRNVMQRFTYIMLFYKQLCRYSCDWKSTD